jgi:predicted nucleotidyltransferase
VKKTLEVLNGLKDKALIDDYAIGGGVATIFYTEPVFTYDLDVFVIVKPELDRKIISLVPIYDYLSGKGCVWKGEHILIEGFPVQFIPASAGVEKEAIEHAKKVAYSGVETKVLSAEYLIAIALKVGRRKDFEKVTRLFDQSKVDKIALKKVLEKHHLLDRFKKWKEKR